MDALLIDLPWVSRLLSGGASDTAAVLQRIRDKFPTAWDFDAEFEEASTGQALESLLMTGQWTGPPHLGARAAQLLCRESGERLDTDSLDDGDFGLVAEALSGVPSACLFVGRVFPPLGQTGGSFPAIGYLMPTEATETLRTWPDPGRDTPSSQVYAAREQIEDWLKKAENLQKSLVMFWE